MSAPPGRTLFWLSAEGKSARDHAEDTYAWCAGNRSLPVHQCVGLRYDQCRIRLDESKQLLISSRLGKRRRQLGLNNHSEYCQLLRSPGQGDEITRAVDALSTNFTHFMREADHFQFLVRDALPAVLGARKRFLIWSAACSTGEEPFTIAFFLAEEFPLQAGWDWQIIPRMSRPRRWTRPSPAFTRKNA